MSPISSRRSPNQASGSVSVAPADVTKTPSPGGPIPMPYPNIATAADGNAAQAQRVKIAGKEVSTKATSGVGMSTGDEAGVHKGVISSKLGPTLSTVADEEADANAPPGTLLAPSQTAVKVE